MEIPGVTQRMEAHGAVFLALAGRICVGWNFGTVHLQLIEYSNFFVTIFRILRLCVRNSGVSASCHMFSQRICIKTDFA